MNKKFEIKWIADNRDDWNTREVNDTYGFKKTVFHKLIDWITIKLEKRWVKTASYVTSVSAAYTDRIESFTGIKGKTIYNGYFEEDCGFPRSGIINKNNLRTITIIHNGSLYLMKDIETFLNAYKVLYDKYKGIIHLSLKFLGIKYKKGQKREL